MLQLREEQVEFLARLNKSPEGQALLAILNMLQGELDAALRKARGEDIYRAQGAAEQVDVIISMLTTAQLKLERRATAPRRPAAMA